MGKPSWRRIKTIKVPEPKKSFWTTALDYVTPGKLYKIEVEPRSVPIQSLPNPEPETVYSPPNAEPEIIYSPPNLEPQSVYSPPNAEPESVAFSVSLEQQKWTPESGTECTADGDPSLQRSASLTMDICPVGALIGKIGGSTADIVVDSTKVILFSAGRHCVFSIADAAKTGSLYLSNNDSRDRVTNIEGQLEVTIFEAL